MTDPFLLNMQAGFYFSLTTTLYVLYRVQTVVLLSGNIFHVCSRYRFLILKLHLVHESHRHKDLVNQLLSSLIQKPHGVTATVGLGPAEDTPAASVSTELLRVNQLTQHLDSSKTGPTSQSIISTTHRHSSVETYSYKNYLQREINPLWVELCTPASSRGY